MRRGQELTQKSVNVSKKMLVDMLSVKVFPKTLLLQVGYGSVVVLQTVYVRTCMHSEDVLVYEVYKNSLRKVQM